MTESDNFIQRWARLKRKANAAREADPLPAGAETTAPPPRTRAAMEEPFDLASLPSIESIVADTDIGGFLQSSVPAEWTRAALRRAWQSDAAIRDFIGIAENQWDFNDPDAIPGFGPLRAMDAAPAALTQVSGKLGNIGEALPALPSAAERDRSSPTDRQRFDGDQGAQSAPDESSLTDSHTRSPLSEMREAGGKTESARAVKESEALGNLRRHGGALPR